MLSDLQSGTLIAHAHSELTGQFRLVPALFWDEEFAGLAICGKLLEFKEGQNLPKEIAGTTIYVRDDHAKAWLNQHGITEIDDFFPDQLRTQKRVEHPFRRSRYDWPPFENQAVERLLDEGGISSNWVQADLEREMLEWSAAKWGREPSLRMVRDHVKAAITRFHVEKKKIGLGDLGD